MKKIERIMYAEDSDNDIELTLAAFKESNLANPIDVVKDGAEALDFLFSGVYSKRLPETSVFILLDFKMPKIDGIEVLKEICKSGNQKDIRIFL